MQCYTRSDDYFGEIERFIRDQRGAGNIDHARSRQATAQLNTISGENNTWWGNDSNFVKTAGVVLRMLMLQATSIHAVYEWNKKLVTKNCIAFRCNKDSIHTDGIGQMPCPADSLNEADHIAAYYDTQFDEKKMKLLIEDIPESVGMFGETMAVVKNGAFTETMAIVKKGERDIKFWFIITTWRFCKTSCEHDGYLYEAVPIVAVIYMEGNHQARDDWRREQRQDFFQLEQLMENLNVDDNLRRTIRDNRAEADRDQNAV
jgi:hypothetical protein